MTGMKRYLEEENKVKDEVKDNGKNKTEERRPELHDFKIVEWTNFQIKIHCNFTNPD